MKLLVLVLIAIATLSVPASVAGETGVVHLDQTLRDLASDLRVASLTARPGGEDLEVLALLRRRFGVQTAVILATAGEGVGPVPLWGRVEEERRVRLAEADAAATSVGARLSYLGLPDFGIARSAEETLLRWDRDEALLRLVRAIREFRPQVILTDHRNAARRGSAEAAAALVADAFEAAGDPARFPEAGPAFRVSRVFTACALEEATVTPDTGAVDQVRGTSFALQAAGAREAYRVVEPPEQRPLLPGPRLRPYRLVFPATGEKPETLLGGLPVERPRWWREELVTGTRAEILAELLSLAQEPAEVRPPPDRLQEAILAALNVRLEIDVPAGHLVAGQEEPVRLALLNGGTRKVTLTHLGLLGAKDATTSPENKESEDLGPGRVRIEETVVTAPAEASESFTLRAMATVRIEGGTSLDLEASVVVRVLPAVEIEVRPWGRLIRPVDGEGVLHVVLMNHSSQVTTGPLQVGITGTDRVRFTPPETVRLEPGASTVARVKVVVREGAEPGLFGLRLFYAGQLHQDMFLVCDVNIPLEMTVGVVATDSDAPFQALRALRIVPFLLSDMDLETMDLAFFDTILVGARPFHYRPVLKRVLPRLVQFVEGGGNLALGYSRPGEWSGESLLPEFEFGTERVTREEADLVTMMDDHRLLRVPNRIEDEDFAGWVLERGRYFPRSFSEDRYEVILKCADPGRRLLSALLVAKLGEGFVIQSSLTLRPEIENLNPGALKLLANIVSLPWSR